MLTLILFAFNFHTGFSGQSLFDDYIHSAYNIILAFPVIMMGIYDKVIPHSLPTYPPFLFPSSSQSLLSSFFITIPFFTTFRLFLYIKLIQFLIFRWEDIYNHLIITMNTITMFKHNLIRQIYFNLFILSSCTSSYVRSLDPMIITFDIT